MDRLEQIEKEIEELEEILDSKDKEFFGTPDTSNLQKSFEEYEEKRRPYTSQISKLDRERRLIMPAVLEDDIPDYGDVMPLTEFIDCCKSGGFINYDGFGRYVKDGKESNIEIHPSDVKHNSIRKDFDTIVWYNR
jgi:hypothetical protein